MTVPVLFNHSGDRVDPPTSVRAPGIRETELPRRPYPSSTTAADEFILPDLLRALAGSCCHLARADFCVLTVTSPPALAFDISHIGDTDSIPRQATAATIDVAPAGQRTSLVSPAAARWPTAPPETAGVCLFVEVPIRLGAAVIGRVGLAAQHDHTGFTDQDRDTATTVAAIAGDAVRLVTMIQEPCQQAGPGDGTNDLVDAIVNALYDLGIQLHARTRADATTAPVASIRHTVAALSRAIRQMQSVMYGSHPADLATEDPQ